MSAALLGGPLVGPSYAQGKKKERNWHDDKAPPRFHLIASTDENSTLSMMCEGESPYQEIRCKFQQISVRAPNEANIQEELAKVREAIVRGEDGFSKGPEEIKNKLCPQKGKVDEYASLGSAEVRAYFSRLAALVEEMCSVCTTKECFVEGVLKAIEMQERKCKISTNEFEVSFKRVDLDRWVYTGVQGLCNNAFVVSIEREGSDSLLWTFTQHLIPGRQEKDGLCNFKESKTVFSWRVPDDGMDMSRACPNGVFVFSIL